MKERCKICNNFGFYRNDIGDWKECPNCLSPKFTQGFVSYTPS